MSAATNIVVNGSVMSIGDYQELVHSER